MKKYLLLFYSFLTTVAFSQTFVSTSVENKNVVIEEFTGIHCGFCPAGHLIAQNIQDAHPNDVTLINIHVGSYAEPAAGEPDFRTNWGVQVKNISGLTGYPAGQINRQQFSLPIEHSTSGKPAMSRSFWEDAANTVLSEPSYVNVAAQANINVPTRLLTVNVEAYYTGNGNSIDKLNVLLLQNNIPGPQSGAANHNPDAIISGPWNPTYNHQHMFRHSLTSYWGTTISSTTAGSFYSNTYTYTIPDSLNGVAYDLYNLEVVVFIADLQLDIISGNKSSMYYITSINETSNEKSFVKLYPNPIKEQGVIEFTLNVPADISFEIFDLIGKKVKEKTVTSQLNTGKHSFNLETKDLNNGSYILKYKIQDKISSIKFIVAK